MTAVSVRTPRAVRVLRMGTFFWKVHPETSIADGDRLTRELAARLRADPRVEDVSDPDSDGDHDFIFQQFYPVEPTDMDSILFGRDARIALVRRFPISFRVRVPIKNQPIHNGTSDVPSDTYAVAWNGITLVVTWAQDTERIPLSGGHIVIDVLRDAVSGEHGAALINQACSLNCNFQFMHPAMILAVSPESANDDEFDMRLTPIGDATSRSFELSTYAEDGDDFEVLHSLAYSLMDTANDFAVVKTLGRRIIAIEETARNQLDHIIIHQYRNSQIALLPVRKRLRARWNNRSTTRHIQHSLTALSLCLANLESLNRSWSEENRHFEDTASTDGQLAYFETDSKSENAQINSLDLSHLEIAVQQVADSLNNTAMVTATVRGALAGGVAGGLLGAIATAFGALGG